MAVKFNIPLIIWGETNWDVSGNSPNMILWSLARVRHEHDLRGYEWYDPTKYGLKEKDMILTRQLIDEEILEVELEVLHW